jgi:hypothetical protein
MGSDATHSISRLAAVAAAALLLLGALAAGAESETGSGFGSETERNRFSFHPSIRVTAVADDNVRLREDDSKGDLGMLFFPRVELGYQGRWFDLGADLGADIRRYVDGDSPSDEFFRMSGFAEVGLMPGLTFRLSDAFAPTPVELGKPEDHSANLVQTNRLVAGFRYWRELPGGREMLLSLQGTRLSSESFAADIGNGTIDENFHADFWEGALLGEIQRLLANRTSVFVRTHLRYRTFDDSSASDFGDLAVLIGVRTHWFGNVDFDVAGGYGLLAFDSGSKNRFLGQANLRYRRSDGTTLRLSFVNRNTADIVGNDFIETTGKIGLERRFGERTAASIDLFLSRIDNEVWDSGANVFGGVEARLRRQLWRRTQLELTYRYWDNGGDYGRDDFSQNQVSLSFSYRR